MTCRIFKFSNTLILGVLSEFKRDTSMFTNMLCIGSFSSSALPETQHQAVYDEQKNGSSQAESLEEIEASDWWGTSA